MARVLESPTLGTEGWLVSCGKVGRKGGEGDCGGRT